MTFQILFVESLESAKVAWVEVVTVQSDMLQNGIPSVIELRALITQVLFGFEMSRFQVILHGAAVGINSFAEAASVRLSAV